MDDLAPAYWPTRILLGVGVVAASLTIGVSLLVAAGESLFGEPSSTVPLLASAMALTGLAWMFRIARGPRDEPPPWRYRDR